MASLEIPHTSQEPTTPVDDDSFAAAVHHVAKLLDSPLVTPDATSFEVLRVPFGRFGNDGTLASDMTLSDKVLSGRLIYAPRDPADKGRIHVNRRPLDTHWNWLNYEGEVSNQELTKRLHADWPANGSPFGYEMAGPSDSELYTTLHDSLLPLAPYWQTEASYRYDQVEIDPAGGLHHDSTTALAVRDYQDGMRRLQVTATERMEPGGDIVRCRATVDELDMVELRAYQHSSDANRVIEVPIVDRHLTLGSLSIMLDRLTAEKYPF